MILEQVTGKGIQDSFVEKLFKPLKLKQTSWPIGDALPKPYAHGTTVQTLDDKLDDATHRNPSWAFTAGELVSPTADMRPGVLLYATGSPPSSPVPKKPPTLRTPSPKTPQRAHRHRPRHHPALTCPAG